MSFRELLRTVYSVGSTADSSYLVSVIGRFTVMLEFVQHLPNLRVLNLQEASVPTDCWSRLERCPCLEHLC